MGQDSASKLPPGRQPYDPLVGARVGGLAGGILGGVVMALTSLGSFWFVLVGAFAGALVGYRWERNRM